MPIGTGSLSVINEFHPVSMAALGAPIGLFRRADRCSRKNRRREYQFRFCDPAQETAFILVITALIVVRSRAGQPLSSISRKTYLFLALSALARRLMAVLLPRAQIGSGFRRCPDRQAQRRARCCIRSHVSRQAFRSQKLAGYCAHRHRHHSRGAAIVSFAHSSSRRAHEVRGHRGRA